MAVLVSFFVNILVNNIRERNSQLHQKIDVQHEEYYVHAKTQSKDNHLQNKLTSYYRKTSNKHLPAPTVNNL